MPHPKTIWVFPLIALVSTGFPRAVAQDPIGNAPVAKLGQQAPALAQPPMTMKRLLGLWEDQSKKLKTLEFAIYRIDKNPAWHEEEHYVGHAAFQTPQPAFLDFRKVKVQMQADPKDKSKMVPVPVKKNGEIESTPYERIVCAEKELWHYRYENKQILIFPPYTNDRKRALGEGLFPFLFNVSAAEAEKRYQMVLKREDDTKYLIMITPLRHENWAGFSTLFTYGPWAVFGALPGDSFSTAWVYLDKESLLPTRIYLVGADGKSSKDFMLSRIHMNEPVDPQKFVGVDFGKPWKVERMPGG